MDWDLVLSSIWPLLDGAVRGTIPLALVSFALGLVLALLAALARLSPRWWLSGIARFYISVIRGTPLIVQLYVVFFGLPSIDVVIPPWPSAILVLSLNVGGYAAEIIRAAILSIPRGQWEAAYTIGMPRWLALRRIILPQAVRVSVPPLSNTFISLVKDTALTSLILVTEMFRRAQQIAAFSNEFLVLYIEAAVLYWVICLVLSTGQGTLERRLERHVA
ncbi:amino acid ABC transporter permease [Labedella populi]|uniref:Amino acid ABC transporter permease n=1 Tax=Labedella populi TaxID=2498850 RepID=A0A3S4B2K6_9MICO|nr:amino acid ABC transporter permease [Labedella populi]RWZ61476.1 amino acid ABC transporter permease [Labedella populi]